MAPKDEDVARRLLDDAAKAAADIRREEGFWSRLLRYLEQRSAQRHELRKLAREIAAKAAADKRCREGNHVYGNYTHHKDTKVYATGANPETALPIRHDRTWLGYCKNCGVPKSVKQTI